MEDSVSVKAPTEEQTEVAQDSGPEFEADIVKKKGEGESEVVVRCAYCGESLARDELPRFSRSFGIIVLVVGLLLSVFMLLLLGLPLVVIGAYMATASRSVWACEECGAVVDRNDK